MPLPIPRPRVEPRGGPLIGADRPSWDPPKSLEGGPYRGWPLEPFSIPAGADRGAGGAAGPAMTPGPAGRFPPGGPSIRGRLAGGKLPTPLWTPFIPMPAPPGLGPGPPGRLPPLVPEKPAAGRTVDGVIGVMGPAGWILEYGPGAPYGC